MGLEMYLVKMPRYKNETATDVSKVERYLDWKSAQENPFSEWKGTSLEDYCGFKENELPPQDVIDFYGKQCTADEAYHNIMEEVAYWRKNNAIHQWFVDNVQDGIDDCDYHNEVTPEHLEKLIGLCAKVLTNREMADRLLPTQDGFFFGGLEYDEWYFKGIAETVNTLVDVALNTDFETEMLYYISSW